MSPPVRPPSAPFIRLCELLNRHDVEYLIVGSEALAFHGVPRYSLDFDLYLRPHRANLFRAKSALQEFGFAERITELDPEVWARTRQTLRLGDPPFRIDLLLQLSGVDYEPVSRAANAGHYGEVPVRFITRDDLIVNKRAAGRPKDLADVSALEDAARLDSGRDA